jgi:hypothetical protein
MQPRDGVGILALALAALAGGLYLATPFAAAGHRAEAKTRRTLSCATDEGALQIWAFATDPSIRSAGVTVSTGNPTVPTLATDLLQVSSLGTHYAVAAGSCHSTAKHVVLSHRGLTPAGVMHAGDFRFPAVYCAVTRRVLIRLLVSYSASEKPTAATIEVVTVPRARGGKTPKSKRLGYVQWSPKRSVTYYASACTSQLVVGR